MKGYAVLFFQNLESSISVLFYPNLLFHVTLRFMNLRSGYKTKKHGYIKYAWLCKQLQNITNYHIDFFAIYIMLLSRYKLYWFTSSLSSQREPQGKTKQEIAQKYFVYGLRNFNLQ